MNTKGLSRSKPQLINSSKKLRNCFWIGLRKKLKDKIRKNLLKNNKLKKLMKVYWFNKI